MTCEEFEAYLRDAQMTVAQKQRFDGVVPVGTRLQFEREMQRIDGVIEVKRSSRQYYGPPSYQRQRRPFVERFMSSYRGYRRSTDLPWFMAARYALFVALF